MQVQLVALTLNSFLYIPFVKLSMMFISVHYHIIIPIQALRHIQTDYEKRLKDVETQKEQLLDEMEARETTLINKVRKLC